VLVRVACPSRGSLPTQHRPVPGPRGPGAQGPPDL